MGDGGAHLELRTDAANYHFENWRLAHDIVHEARRHALTARVFEVVGGPDFVHARLSAFHNHLTRYRSALYFFTGGEDIINLHRVVPQTGQGFELVCMCPGLSGRIEDTPPKLDVALNPSVTTVQASTSAMEDDNDTLLLVSTGNGDLQLLQEAGAQISQKIYPLTASPPLIGCRSLCVATAYICSPGDIRAVVWGVQPKTETAPARFDAHVLTLQYDVDPLVLHVKAVQMLCLTEYPLHAVISDPTNDGVLVAASPLTDIPSFEQHSWGGGNDEDDDDVSPRTLQAAAARLAKYTSEEEGGGPSDQWADFFRVSCLTAVLHVLRTVRRYLKKKQRTGIDSTSSADAECVVYAFSCQPQPPGPPTPSPMRHDNGTEASPLQEPTIHTNLAALQPLSQVSCLPHKLVAKGQWDEKVLLGLADDVDCAVVSLSIRPSAPTSPLLSHDSSIPALSYVSAGKTQRKMVLLGRPGSCIAAVILETQKYVYLYRPVPKDGAYGEHQVYDLGLSSDAFILGAALLDDTSPSSAQLHVLTTNELIVLDLQ